MCFQEDPKLFFYCMHAQIFCIYYTVEQSDNNFWCPRLSDWQFPAVVVVVVAIEPCELWDCVQMQGNGGSNQTLGARIVLTVPPHHSQMTPLANKHCSVANTNCRGNMLCAILIVGACRETNVWRDNRATMVTCICPPLLIAQWRPFLRLSVPL